MEELQSNSTPPPGDMMMAAKPEIGWRNATEMWGSYWDGYKYTAMGINSVLIIWTVANLLFILIRGKKYVSRQYFLTLNLMVLIFSITRLLFYAIDPKSVKGLMPSLLGNLLLNSSFPTLTVGFFMLYVALRQCTVPNRHLLPMILKTKCIASFIIICFLVSYMTDILVSHFYTMQVMIMVCQLFYIVWGLVFFGLYSALVIQYRGAVRKARHRMERTCYRVGHCRRGFSRNNLKEIPVCVKISCVTALLFLALALLNIFLVLLEVGFLEPKSTLILNLCKKYRKAWPFFAFHVTFNFVEHSMAIMLALAGTQPLKWIRISSVTISNAARSGLMLPTNLNISTIEMDIETSFTDLTTQASTSQQTLSSAAEESTHNQAGVPHLLSISYKGDKT